MLITKLCKSNHCSYYFITKAKLYYMTFWYVPCDIRSKLLTHRLDLYGAILWHYSKPEIES